MNATSNLIESITCSCYFSATSFNQPTFCPNASWNPDATTFATQTVISSPPIALFINRHDTIVAGYPEKRQLLIWFNASADVPIIIPANLSSPHSVFVTDEDVIFVDNGCPYSRIERWSLTNHSFLSSIPVDQHCRDLFVDGDDVYCSPKSLHQVVKYSWRHPSRPPIVVAGTNCAGSTSSMLNEPHGIFVSKNKDLYVADYGNDRIQKYRSGDRNGITVAVSGASETILLSRPTGVVVDGDGYLFIVDQWNNRVVGSDANGFRCIAGCTDTSDLAANKLYMPHRFSFDSLGNLYVVERYKYRIRKFALLSNSLCSKSSTR